MLHQLAAKTDILIVPHHTGRADTERVTTVIQEVKRWQAANPSLQAQVVLTFTRPSDRTRATTRQNFQGAGIAVAGVEFQYDAQIPESILK